MTTNEKLLNAAVIAIAIVWAVTTSVDYFTRNTLPFVVNHVHTLQDTVLEPGEKLQLVADVTRQREECPAESHRIIYEQSTGRVADKQIRPLSAQKNGRQIIRTVYDPKELEPGKYVYTTRVYILCADHTYMTQTGPITFTVK